jgi:hypothetical protein
LNLDAIAFHIEVDRDMKQLVVPKEAVSVVSFLLDMLN